MRTARPLDVLVLSVCAAVLLHAFAVEPFQVPTGSMAPTLLGHHRLCTCPHCGTSVAVGRCAHAAYSSCPSCGESSLALEDVPETAGDHILVNKAAFAFRRPRRWEVVVFRLFGIVLIKRIVGLPGETVLIRDGDVYIDGRLARKPFTQAWAMRVPVFAYGSKCPPLRDEYPYNAGRCPAGEPVHDFLVEADVDVQAGDGSLALRLCDGQDWVEVQLPAGRRGTVTTRSWPMSGAAPGTTCISRPSIALLQARHHIAMAFVDRRVNVMVDGRPVVTDLDLPAPGARASVRQPVQLDATGAVVIRDYRLYRDVHYADRGRTAVGGEPVHLGVEQYFVLGDNSANSEDSRTWSPDAVSEAQLLGSAFLVHLPSRAWRVGGRDWQLPNFTRIRWIH
jgi:signal peptidase I